MNNQKLQDGLNFLYRDQRVRLVHGVLKGLGIPVQRDDYADLFQEGCLVFAQVYAAFPEPLTTPAAEQKLMNYAYRKIRWRRSNRSARRYLQLALQDRFSSDTAIAQYYGVSRQAVHQWKKQLIATARQLKADWPDMV